MIELLVVVAVIGTLAGMVLVNTGAARWKARDVRRIADMKQLVIAQEMVMSDNFRYYTCSTTGGDCGGKPTNYPSTLGVRMPRTPEDPRNVGTLCNGTAYIYCGLENVSNNQDFCYWAKLEESANSYLTASSKGTQRKDAIPVSLADCGTPG